MKFKGCAFASASEVEEHIKGCSLDVLLVFASLDVLLVFAARGEATSAFLSEEERLLFLFFARASEEDNNIIAGGVESKFAWGEIICGRFSASWTSETSSEVVESNFEQPPFSKTLRSLRPAILLG